MLIKNIKNGLWWSNDWGWGSKKGATVFTKEESNYLNLPIDGVWIKG